jgi:hypothetical protein
MTRRDHLAPEPVFLDRSGRRQRVVALAGTAGGLLLALAALALIAGFTGAGPSTLPGWPAAAPVHPARTATATAGPPTATPPARRPSSSAPGPSSATPAATTPSPSPSPSVTPPATPSASPTPTSPGHRHNPSKKPNPHRPVKN